jgi:hypothetical protein
MSRKSKTNDPATVRKLQRLLNAMKLGNLPEDGQFNSGTENAIKELQRRLGKNPTGRASGSLMRQLADAAAISPCVQASASTVVAVNLGGREIRDQLVAIAASAGPMTGVELARSGTWHLSTGKRTFTAEDLKDAADFFAASGQGRIPLGFGHSDSRFDGDPAFGWVSNIRYDEDDQGPVLLGDLVDMDDWLAAAAPKRWPNRSIEGFAGLEWNGRTYRLALTRLALLGSTPPAMPTLRSLADVRQAISAAAESPTAEFISASAQPSEQDATDPAVEAVVTREMETGMDPAKFREALGLTDDLTDDEVMSALADAGFIPQTDPPEGEVTPVAAAAAPVAGTVVLASSVWEQAQEQIKRLTAITDRADRNERDAVITEAVKAGKFTPAQRPHFARLWDADPKGTRILIDNLTKNTALSVAASGHAGETDDDALEAEFAHLFPPTATKGA